MLRIILFSLAMSLSQLSWSEQNCPKDYESTSTTPSFQFSISGDEVTDNLTSLIWQQCSVGLSGIDCNTGTAQKYTWQQALQYAEDYSNSTGKNWRLPNIKELHSITEFNCITPARNLTIFPNPAALYWSATTYAPITDSAWTTNSGDGASTYTLKTINLNIRLVRSN